MNELKQNNNKDMLEQIGGANIITEAADIFYRKVLHDPAISHFFDYIEMNQQQAKLESFIMHILGGSPKSSKKPLKKVHSHMNLTDEHFNKVEEHLLTTLAELNISCELIEKAKKIIDQTHDDIVQIKE